LTVLRGPGLAAKIDKIPGLAGKGEKIAAAASITDWHRLIRVRPAL